MGGIQNEVRNMFPFLIGTVRTVAAGALSAYIVAFPFLIGTVRTLSSSKT